MRVWVIEDYDHGDTQLWDESVDPLEIPFVKTELSYLVGAYDDELEEFKQTIENGYGSIEERFSISKKEINTL